MGGPMARGGDAMRDARKVLVLFAQLAVFGVAILLVAGSVIGTRPPAALASGLSSVTDYPVPGGDPGGRHLTAVDVSGLLCPAVTRRRVVPVRLRQASLLCLIQVP